MLQDVPALVHLTPLRHGGPAERLGHRRLERLRPIDDHQEAPVGAEPVTREIGQQALADRRVLRGSFPEAERVFGPCFVDAQRHYDPCFVDAQRHYDTVPADLDPIDLSMHYTDRLADAGIAPSVGSRGDSYDNALVESVIGLFKTEVIRRRGPWRNLEAVEFATLAWVDWFNTRRLLEPIGYVPPAEYEAQYYQQAAVA